jgi:hypothetical protein
MADQQEPKIITLDVGGRKIRALRTTLETSPMLRVKIDWLKKGMKGDLLDDGSLFVDADPNLFGHLLQHMRRPLYCPLFWSFEAGFDY